VVCEKLTSHIEPPAISSRRNIKCLEYSTSPKIRTQMVLPRGQQMVELPSLNRKLHGKVDSSFSHAVETAQIEEQRLGEAERRTHGEGWEQHGRGRERSRASRKGASKRETAGKPWRGLKANLSTW